MSENEASSEPKTMAAAAEAAHDIQVGDELTTDASSEVGSDDVVESETAASGPVAVMEGQPQVEASINGSDGEEEEVLAAAVVVDDDEEGDDDHDDEVESIGEPVGSTVVVVKEEGSTPTPIASSPIVAKKRKQQSTPPRSPPSLSVHIPIRPERRQAAEDARVALADIAGTLPFPVGESVIRSFGRLLVEPRSGSQKNMYATTASLYPIGFSCDRFEFSPVHGRTLKLRCSILDGKQVQKKIAGGGFPPNGHSSVTLTDGPIFRITWGRGVDEDVDSEVEYAYDPFVDSPAIVSDDASSVLPPSVKPVSENMRVRVRFSDDESFLGHVEKVLSSKRIVVRYDDGSREEMVYPDPDLSIASPGT